MTLAMVSNNDTFAYGAIAKTLSTLVTHKSRNLSDEGLEGVELDWDGHRIQVSNLNQERKVLLEGRLPQDESGDRLLIWGVGARYGKDTPTGA